MNKRSTIIIIIVILLIGNVYFAIQSSLKSSQLASINAQISIVSTNQKILGFSRMFIDDVLNSDKEVDFDTRLKLENAVRDIKDPEILAQWSKFVNSETEAQAQVEVKNLLALLMKKI
jgi:hypothetical protein